MNNTFLQQLYKEHHNIEKFPKQERIYNWSNELLALMFPILCERCIESEQELQDCLNESKETLIDILSRMDEQYQVQPSEIGNQFFDQIDGLYSKVKNDAVAIELGDPAAVSETEVVLTYPGFYAIAFYRIAKVLYDLKVPLIPRLITEYASTKTGIEIHPGAVIGKNFCIDHGSGVVIGATCVIGDNVKLYQGVTLGALSVAKEMADTKRHPTIEDNVIIYSGATILGGETTVGKNSIIGGNVWLTRSIPAGSIVYHQAQVKFKNQEETNIKSI